MTGRDAVIAAIQAAFRDVAHPGDDFLQGSHEGCEPAEVAEAFRGRHDWTALDGAFLDQVGGLSFLSDGAFRFFLPAFLVADLRGELESEDPFFHLTHGFHEGEVEIPVGGERFVRKLGRSAFINPLRYGAMTWHDYGLKRLAVFTREEAGAIVGYLEHRRDQDELGLDRDAANAALGAYWLERAANAPTAEELQQHLDDEERFQSALQ